MKNLFIAYLILMAAIIGLAVYDSFGYDLGLRKPKYKAGMCVDKDMSYVS